MAPPVEGGSPIRPSAVDPDLFLQQARSQPRRTLVALDIDGTISAIAPSPGEAVVDDEVRASLQHLSERYHLWFISGREADEARRMIPIAAAGYIGSHGLEVLDEHGLRPLISVEEVQPQLHKLVQAVTADVPEVTSYVERKRWSVAFHYRAVPLSSRVAARLRRSADGHLPAGMRLKPGKMVLEVIPAVGLDKGTALDWLIGAVAPQQVLTAGDDSTDVAMFEALAKQRAEAGIDGLSVGVLHGDDTPEAVVASADTTVDGVQGLHRLLITLLHGP